MSEHLGELFTIARQYGQVRIHTMENGKYHACIVFNTIKHTELQARSDFDQKTPEDAVRQAINAAQTIIDSVEQMSQSLPKRRLLS